MAGTTGLEPAASAVTVGKSLTGTSRINRLRRQLSATVGFIGQGRVAFVQRFVQRSVLLLAVVLSLLTSAVHAQTFRVPFHSVNSMILLDGQVNGKPVVLVLDTGAVQTQVDRKTMMRHEDFSVLYVDLKISTYRHSDYRILATDLHPILKGIPADGILGEDWLRSFRAVRIDYEANVIEFEK